MNINKIIDANVIKNGKTIHLARKDRRGTDKMASLIKYLTLAGSLGLSVLSGCFPEKNNPEPSQTVPEPFQTVLAEYRRKADHGDECGCGVETYLRRVLDTDFQGSPIKISEMEITCEKGYILALAQMARYVVAERELFPDGRVNVLWDPGNKYKPTNTQVK